MKRIKARLKFAKGNAKLGKETAIFSLPAGHTCAGALQCLAMADRNSGKITTGKQAVFRCYAVSQENLFRNVRTGRWNNFEKLKNKTLLETIDLIVIGNTRETLRKLQDDAQQIIRK